MWKKAARTNDNKPPFARKHAQACFLRNDNDPMASSGHMWCPTPSHFPQQKSQTDSSHTQMLCRDSLHSRLRQHLWHFRCEKNVDLVNITGKHFGWWTQPSSFVTPEKVHLLLKSHLCFGDIAPKKQRQGTLCSLTHPTLCPQHPHTQTDASFTTPSHLHVRHISLK